MIIHLENGLKVPLSEPVLYFTKKLNDYLREKKNIVTNYIHLYIYRETNKINFIHIFCYKSTANRTKSLMFYNINRIRCMS